MKQEITTIDLGGINCYLLKTDAGFALIDTAFLPYREKLEKELSRAGCEPGNLKLVVLTHGDIDHTGNGAWLRGKFGATIAMHRSDSGMVERGDMGWNRKSQPDKISLIFRIMSKVFGKPRGYETFKPDLYFENGQALSEYGFDAQILHLPGHSKGSIGVLTADGELFCGDLFYNMVKPGLFSYIDDLSEWNASVEKLRRLKIKTVYPGHGKPARAELFIKNHAR